MNQPSPLSYEYVHDTIFRKLSDTCARYKNVLPEMGSIEQAIVSADRENYHELTLIVIDILETNAERSRIIQELLGNVRMDYWHGVDSKYPAHAGKFYIGSVAENE